MARDPMQGVINWFALLMCAVLLTSAALAGWMAWRVWLLLSALLGG